MAHTMALGRSSPLLLSPILITIQPPTVAWLAAAFLLESWCGGELMDVFLKNLLSYEGSEK